MERRTRTSYSVERQSVVEALPAKLESLEWNLPSQLVWGQQTKHFQMVTKRVIDLIVASLLLALMALPMLVVAIAIKLDSRGPVLYAQERVGHHGRLFRMFKFRSMYLHAENGKTELLAQNETDGPLFKMKYDPRRTRIGQFIRRFSIDEFPQLINVLQGHMSLIGPRPALPHEAAKYEDYHAQRVVAVPGMTGLWQVSGRSLLAFEQMVELDVQYARNWSIWLDLFILMKTIPVILSGKGAY